MFEGTKSEINCLVTDYRAHLSFILGFLMVHVIEFLFIFTYFIIIIIFHVYKIIYIYIV